MMRRVEILQDLPFRENLRPVKPNGPLSHPLRTVRLTKARRLVVDLQVIIECDVLEQPDCAASGAGLAWRSNHHR